MLPTQVPPALRVLLWRQLPVLIAGNQSLLKTVISVRRRGLIIQTRVSSFIKSSFGPTYARTQMICCLFSSQAVNLTVYNIQWVMLIMHFNKPRICFTMSLILLLHPTTSGSPITSSKIKRKQTTSKTILSKLSICAF
jgi:hypothetical protein